MYEQDTEDNVWVSEAVLRLRAIDQDMSDKERAERQEGFKKLRKDVFGARKHLPSYQGRKSRQWQNGTC